MTLGNQMSADADWTYLYDKEGNLKEKDTTAGGSSESWTYAYSGNNLLTEVKHYDSTATLVLTVDYKYDAFGEEIQRDTSGSINTTTKFGVDGWNSNADGATGNAGMVRWAVLNSNGTLQTRNIEGNGTDQHLGRIDQTGASDPSGAYYLIADRLNSTRDVINASGTQKDSIKYDGFGKIQGGELDSLYRGGYAYTGREIDAETDLQWNHARWYDAKMGRWISQDPLGFDAGDSNLYRYVNNRATGAVDPSGLWEDDMHFWMTYYVANLMGFGKYKREFGGEMKDEAYIMAFSAVYVDYDSRTLPGTSDSTQRMIYHFPIISKKNGGTGKVAAGDDNARLNVWKGIAQEDPILFGVGLHVLQDSYSHDGFETQHLLGVTYAGHGVDIPWHNHVAAGDTVDDTVRSLWLYARRNHHDDFFRKGDWDKEGKVDQFIKEVKKKIAPVLNESAWDQKRKQEIRTWNETNYDSPVFSDELKHRNTAWRRFVKKELGVDIDPPYAKGDRLDKKQRDQFYSSARHAMMANGTPRSFMKGLKSEAWHIFTPDELKGKK